MTLATGTENGVQSIVNTASELAWSIYNRFRDNIETPENIGKMIIIDVNSGDYEIAPDELCLAETERLRVRHSDVDLIGLRVGYKAAVSFCGDLERLP